MDGQLQALRGGWPEAILTGRYTFRTRRRDTFENAVAELGEVVTAGLADTTSGPRTLEIRVAEGPVMVVVGDTGRIWPQVPPGLTACGLHPPGPLLTLLPHVDVPPGPGAPTRLLMSLFRPGTRRQESRYAGGRLRLFLFRPRVRDVWDNRLGTVIGRLERPLLPRRTVIRDPAGRVVATLHQPWVSLLFFPLPARFTITAGGRPVARIRERFRFLHHEFRVDVSGAAGLIDPRLILAAGILQFGDHSRFP